MRKTELVSTSKITKKQQLKNDISAWLLILPLVLVMYLFVWRPTVMGAVWSLFDLKGYTPQEFIGFRNYIDVLTDTEFLPILWNTIQYVFWSLVVGFLPPVAIAIMINEVVHFKNTYKVLIYLPAVIPAIASGLMWYFMYYPDSTGLLNSFLNIFGIEPYRWLDDGNFTILYIIISMTWHGLPTSMMLYYAALQSVSVERYEAATIDGAGMWARLWNITIPQIRGILLIAFVRQIIGVFQVMEQPMAMTAGGPNGASISLGYQLYRYGFVSGRTGHALALGVITFIILMIMTCFYFYLNKKVESDY